MKIPATCHRLEAEMETETRNAETHVYQHVVQYYETDAMQIVHHSNYIRWMEEARLDFMRAMGLSYDKMEAQGVIIPVLSAECKYKMATRYGETVKIFSKMEKFNGLRFSVSYTITDQTEKVVHATGTTTHCFLDKNMHPVNIKKCAPEIYAFFSDYR